MWRSFRREPLRGGIYHASLILISFSAFNFGFAKLTGIDIAGRVFAGVNYPIQLLAIALCAASVVVIWNNWID